MQEELASCRITRGAVVFLKKEIAGLVLANPAI